MIHCPGCGAGLRFDIETQMMRCDYCGSSHDPYAFDSEKGDAKQGESFDTYVWVCPSCGGQLETPDETDAMGFCPYCGGASLLFDKIRRQWRPAEVIPFTITKEQCKAAYLKEARKHPFVSRKYKDPQLLESFRGIYMPYWTYRVKHQGQYAVAAETGERQEGDYRVSKVYTAVGEIDTEVDGYAHDASQAFDDRLSEDLSPFDPAGKKPFTPGFLSGFYTVIGDRPRRDFDGVITDYAKRKAVESLTARKTAVHKTLAAKGATHVRVEESIVPTEIVSAERTLYPIWFMSYRQGDKLTYAAVNGQTGKVSADFPASPVRLAVFSVILAAAIFALLCFFPSMKASGAALITSLLFVLGNFVLNRSFKNLIAQSKELEISPEAVAYKKGKTLRTIIAVAAVVLGFGIFFTEPAYNIGPYLFCIALAVIFFFFIYKFIRFQLAVASRRPPQMNRKGASSDEK